MFLVPLTRPSRGRPRSLDRLFDDRLSERCFTPAAWPEAQVARRPALDVTESDSGYTVAIEMPGVTKDEVKVTVDGRRVTVQASAARDDEKKSGDRLVYRERSASGFERSFTLPMEVEHADSTARMEHGVLTLTLAKRGAGKATRINVS